MLTARRTLLRAVVVSLAAWPCHAADAGPAPSDPSPGLELAAPEVARVLIGVRDPEVTDPKNGLAFTEIDAANALQLVRPMTAASSVNRSTFAVGQTLVAGGGVANPGLIGLGDFYVGIARPDGTIQFFTPAGIVVGTAGHLASFRPLAAGVSLAKPFAVNEPAFYTRPWAAGDPRGAYVFFVLVVKSGALAGGAVTGDQILALATAAFALQ